MEDPGDARMTMQLERVIQEIRDERLRQDIQWGGPEFDDAHPTEYFLEFIDRRLCAEAMLKLVENDLPGVRKRLIQIAALALAAVGSIDRRTQG